MICAICNNDKFVGTLPDRPARACSKCGAMERHRALWKLLKIKSDDKVLEIAPLSKNVFGNLIKRNFSKFYVGVDKYENGNPKDKRDVSFCNMYFDLIDMENHINDDSIDCFIMQHVLEEIEDYKKCFTNIHYALKENGTAYLEIPNHIAESHVKIEANSFGNVWRFSKSQLQFELRLWFPSVETVEYQECGVSGNIFVCKK